jgi:hypothetical protein
MLEKEIKLQKFYEGLRYAVNIEIKKHLMIDGKLVSQVFGFRDEDSVKYEYDPTLIMDNLNNIDDFIEANPAFEEDYYLLIKLKEVFNQFPIEEMLVELKRVISERLKHFTI